MKKSIFTILLVCSAILSHAHVGLLYPEGGEMFISGQEVVIEWEIIIAHDTQNWDLFFSPDGGDSWETIAIDIAPENLSYTWNVPGISTEQAKIRIVMDNTGTDYEDESDNFSIINDVGIQSVDKNDPDLNIYPNPAGDHLYLASTERIENPLISFIDMQGRVVLSYEAEVISANDPFEVKLFHLKPGFYSFQVSSVNSLISRKIIVR